MYKISDKGTEFIREAIKKLESVINSRRKNFSSDECTKSSSK